MEWLHYLPKKDYAGEDGVSMFASNNSDPVQSARVNLQVSVAARNDAPIFTVNAIPEATAGVAYSFSLTASDADLGTTLSFETVSAPDWLILNASTGALSGTPTATHVGSQVVTFTVSDGAVSSTFETTLKVNEAPLPTSVVLNVGTYFRVTASTLSLASGAAGVYATGGSALIELPGLPGFSPVTAGAISLFKDSSQIDGFELLNVQLSLSTATIASGAAQWLSLSEAQIAIPSLTYRNGIVTGSISFSAAGGSLFPGGGGFSAALLDGGDGGSAVTAVLDVSTGTVTFASERLAIDFGSSAQIRASNVSLSYSSGGAANQTLATITNASLQFSAIPGVNANFNNLVVRQDGFSISSAAVATTSDPTLGGFLTMRTPTLSFNGIDYTTGGTLTGMITLSAGSASLTLGTGLTLAITDGSDQDSEAISGSYNVATGRFSLGADQVALNIPGVLTATVTGLTVAYDPEGADSQELLVVASAAITASFDYQDKVRITDAGLNLSFRIQADSSLRVSLSNLVLNSASVREVRVVLGNLMTLSATNAFINLNPGPNDDIARFETLSAQLTGLGIGGTARNFAISRTGSLKALSGFGVTLNTDPTALRWPSWLPIRISEAGISWRNFDNDALDFKITFSASVTGLQSLRGIQVAGSVTGAVIDIGLLRQGQFPLVGLAGASVTIGGNLFGGQASGTLFLELLKVDSSNRIIATTDTTTPVASQVLYGGAIVSFTMAGISGFEVRFGVSERGPLNVFVSAGIPILLDPISGLTITNLRAGVTFNSTLPSVTDPLALRGGQFTPTGQQTSEQWRANLKLAVINQISSGQTDFWAAFSQPMKIEGGATLYSAYASTNVFRADIDLIISTDGKFLVTGLFTVGNAVNFRAGLYADLSQLQTGSGTILFLADFPANSPYITIRGRATFGFIGGNGLAASSTNRATGFQISLSGGIDVTALGLATVTLEGSVVLTFTPSRMEIRVSAELRLEVLGQRVSLAGSAGVLILDTSSSTPQMWGALAITTNLGFLDRIGISANAAVLYRLNLTAQMRTEVLNIPGRGGISVELKPLSFSFLAEGYLIYQKDGTEWFRMQGTFEMEISRQGLAVFAVGQLLLGPPSSRFLTFNFTGLLQLSPSGVAAMLDLTLATQFPSSFGLTLDASFYLLLNTTSQQVTFTLPDSLVQIPGGGASRTIVVPGKPNGASGENVPYLQIIARGRLDVRGFILDGSFSLIVSPTLIELQADAQMALNVGNTTLLNFRVSGGFRIELTGVAAAIDLTLSAGPASSAGFRFEASFRLDVNTANRALRLGNVDLVAGIYARIQIAGALVVGPLRFAGSFSLTVGVGLFNIQAQATLDLTVGTTTLISFTVAGGFQMDASGIAAAFALGIRSGLPTNRGYSFQLNFQLELNTTGRALRLGGIDLESGNYTRVRGNGTLVVGGFAIQGAFVFFKDATSIRVEVAATTSLQVGSTRLFEFNVVGGFQLDTSGLAASVGLTLRSGLPSNMGFSVSLTFRLDVNTTSSARTIASITVAAGAVRIFGSGSLTLGGVITLNGSFSFTVASDRVVISASATLNFLGTTLSVSADLGIYTDGIAARFSLSANLSTGFFTLSGSLDFQLNTTGSSRFGVAPRTLLVRVTNVQLRILGLTLSGSLSIGWVNGSFEINIPSSSPLTVSVAGLVTVSVSGYIRQNGTFSITGSAQLNLGRRDIVGISGTLSVTIANTGFSANLNGQVYILNRQVATAGGSMSVNGTSYSLSLWISFNFNVFDVLQISGSGTLNINNSGLNISFTANATLFGLITFQVSAGLNTARGTYYFVGRGNFSLGNSNIGASASFSLHAANYNGSAAGINFGSGFSVSISGSAWAGFSIAGHRIGASAGLAATFGSDGRASVSVSACVNLWFWRPCASVRINIDLRNGFRVWLSDIANATVFFDANKNGQVDAGEFSTITDADGRFGFASDGAEADAGGAGSLGVLQQYDKNQDGQLDETEGRFIVLGGVDTITGSPSTTPFVLPGTNVVGVTKLKGATVFFDLDGDGDQGADEVAVTTDDSGTFSFLPPGLGSNLGLLTRYDSNNNGVLDASEGQLRVIATLETDKLLKDVETDNGFLSGYAPLPSAELIYFDANFNGKPDVDEVSVKPDASGFYSFVDLKKNNTNDLGKLAVFDVNRNGVIDDSEGEFVVIGGLDKNTGLPNTQKLSIPASGYGTPVQSNASALTVLKGALRRSGLDGGAADNAIQYAFGLPITLQVDLFDPRNELLETTPAVPFVLSASENLNVLNLVGGGVLGSDEPAAARAIQDELASRIRDFQSTEPRQLGPDLFLYNAQFDLANNLNVRAVLGGAAKRLGLTIDASRLDTVAAMITALNLEIDKIAKSDVKGDLITTFSAVKGVAQTSSLSAARQVIAGTLSTSAALSGYTGTGLATKIAAFGRPPYIVAIPDMFVSGSLVRVPLRVENPGGLAEKVTVSVSADNDALFPKGSVVVEGANEDRTIVLRPAADVRGASRIVITASVAGQDGKLLSSTEVFVVTAIDKNAAPALTEIADATVGSTGSVSVQFQISDTEKLPDALEVTATSSDETILTSSGLQITGTGSTRNLKITPLAGQSGTVAVKVSVSDGFSNVVRTFAVQVLQQNGSPIVKLSAKPGLVGAEVSAENAVTMPESSRVTALMVDLADRETEPDLLQLRITFDNSSLFDDGNVVVDGSGSRRTLTLMPVPGRNGMAQITLSVGDGTNETQQTFSVSVTSVNEPPSVSVTEETEVQAGKNGSVTLSVSDDETGTGALQFSISSSAEEVLPSSAFQLSGSGEVRVVSFQAPAGSAGETVVTVRVSDGTLESLASFKVNVTGGDAKPVISAIPDQVIALNSVSSAIHFAVSDRETPGAELVVSVTSSNAQLINSSGFFLSGFGGSRTLSLVPVKGRTGSTEVTVHVTEGVNSATRTFKAFVEDKPLSVKSWESVANHGSAGDIAASIPSTGVFVESRLGGLNQLRVNFSAPIDPAYFSPSQIGLIGVTMPNNLSVDLSGVQWTTQLVGEGKVGVISFGPGLPDMARYRVVLKGVLGLNGLELKGDMGRVFTVLAGDLNGDRSLNSLDTTALRAARGSVVKVGADPLVLRADINGDGSVNNRDLAGLLTLLGREAIGLGLPGFPSGFLPSLPGDAPIQSPSSPRLPGLALSTSSLQLFTAYNRDLLGGRPR